MHCALIGCSLFIMVNFSVSLHIFQAPRFLGVKSQRSVPIHCVANSRDKAFKAKWFTDLDRRKPVVENDRFKTSQMGNLGQLRISNVQPHDSAVYYCELNGTLGPGTELQVFRKINVEQEVKRSRIKDAMIIIQALLLAAVIAALVFYLKQDKKEEDIIYENPEDNHIYEGFEIEQCDLYEDIPAYCSNSEANSEKAESTCEE